MKRVTITMKRATPLNRRKVRNGNPTRRTVRGRSGKIASLTRAMSGVTVSAPIARGTISRAPQIRQTHIEGPMEEYLCTVIARKVDGSAGDPAGTVLLQVGFNPGTLNQSRMFAYSRLYSLYRFKKIWADVTPACPTTIDGSYAVGFQKDVSFRPTNVIPYVMGLQGAKSAPMWAPVRVTGDCSLSGTRQRMFAVDPTEDLSESTQFNLILALVTPVTSAESASFNIRFGYVIEFSGPINDLGAINKILDAGATFQIGSDGVLAGTTIGEDGTVNNGKVYTINPMITRGLGLNGQDPVRACVNNSNAGANKVLGFTTVEAAFNSTFPDHGNIVGNATNYLTNVQHSFIQVGRSGIAALS